MALQDLTPQLRTRLSRMERAVGWFVVLAIVLLAGGFIYYVYNTAERRGWFKIKAPFYTFVTDASGLKPGDPVRLMGFDVGQITRITAMPADQYTYNVYVEFELKEPFYDYMWTEGSRAKVTSADLLGKRVLEVTRGTNGYVTYVFHPVRTNVPVSEIRSLPDLPHWVIAQEVYAPDGTNLLAKPLFPLSDLGSILGPLTTAGYTALNIMDTNQSRRAITGIWDYRQARYEAYTLESKPYWLVSDESPAIAEQLQQMVANVQAALPNVFHLTNVLGTVLSNTADLTSNLNVVAVAARPAVTNLAAATANLDQPGALGERLLPTNLTQSIQGTLTNASDTLVSANTNLAALAENLGRTLDNLAGMTSNLNHQVQVNTNLLSSVSEAVVHADQFVQGLKHFWLFRHLFKAKETNAPPPRVVKPLRSPKEKNP